LSRASQVNWPSLDSRPKSDSEVKRWLMLYSRGLWVMEAGLPCSL
jgi:hypothetical protein